MIIKAVIIYVILSYFIIPLLFFINEKYNMNFGVFWYSESTDTKYNNFCKCMIIAPVTVVLFILEETARIIAYITEYIIEQLYETIMKFCNKSGD